MNKRADVMLTAQFSWLLPSASTFLVQLVHALPLSVIKIRACLSQHAEVFHVRFFQFIADFGLLSIIYCANRS